MPLSEVEKKQIADAVYKQLKGDIDHLKNNVHNQLNGVYKTLNNNADDARVSHAELSAKVDQLMFTLVGNDFDKENSFFARFKKVESFLEIVKEKKAYVVGGWIAISAMIGMFVAAVYFLIQVINFFKHGK